MFAVVVTLILAPVIYTGEFKHGDEGELDLGWLGPRALLSYPAHKKQKKQKQVETCCICGACQQEMCSVDAVQLSTSTRAPEITDRGIVDHWAFCMQTTSLR